MKLSRENSGCRNILYLFHVSKHQYSIKNPPIKSTRALESERLLVHDDTSSGLSYDQGCCRISFLIPNAIADRNTV